MQTNDMNSFINEVREYTSLIEETEGLRAYDILCRACIHLSKIYALGMMLKDVEPETEDLADYEGPSMMGKLIAKLGKYDSYSEIYDPIFESELVVASLSDDLADIYADLKGPLLGYDEGRVTDAIWQWKFNLRTHCGDHLVDSLRAMHRLVNDHMDPDYVNE